MWQDMQTWALIVGTIAITVVVGKLKDSLRKLLDHLGGLLFGWIVGRGLLARKALRRYIAKVYEEHREVDVSFRAETSQKMDMESVYVPLSVSDDQHGERPAGASLGDARRTLVLGVPGAGKTMLLKHAVLTWARERHNPDARSRRTWYGRRVPARAPLGELDRIPVLIKLHQVNLDGEIDLRRHIVDHFAANAFPKADRWLDRRLADGDMVLYFDGLDEVAGAKRRRQVADAIREFAKDHDGCRTVVTCRAAVYKGELKEGLDQVLRVEDFDEHLIRRFLRGWPWPETLEGDTVDRLLGALRDTPQLMPLARNPLLLTMIAYLYSTVYAATGDTLPHTRADFYKEVIGSLLDDRQRIPRFSSPVKWGVLQRLALAAQDVPIGVHDRLALAESRVLEVLEEALVDQRRPGEQAQAVLEEIVERTGLLLPIDGGVRYQFAHLTLQEYLAANELAATPEGLLRRYRSDPATWRETVRLWCGVAARDCTDVVREVLDHEPVLAFQCLADAYVVDPRLADRIIDAFQAGLGTEDTDADRRAVASAFGVVAADRREPGPRVFGILEFIARGDVSGIGAERVEAALRALAATNVPQAAEVLATRLGATPVALSALTSMGDLAVPALTGAMRDGLPGAARGLWLIRTPAAALALCEALFQGPPPADESAAAAYLGHLLADGEIEQELAQHAPAVPRRVISDSAWVWQPFATREDDPLIGVAARIAQVLTRATRQTLPEGVVLDPRLATALAMVTPEGEEPPRTAVTDLDPVAAGELSDVAARLASYPGIRFDLDDPAGVKTWEVSNVLYWADRGPRAGAGGARSYSSEYLADLGLKVLRSVGISAFRADLLRSLPVERRFTAVWTLLMGPQVSVAEWQRSGGPSPALDRQYRYEFDRSWHYRLVLAVCFAVSGYAAWRAGAAAFGGQPWGPGWLAWLALAQLAVGWLVLLVRGALTDADELAEYGVLTPFTLVSEFAYMDIDFWMALANLGLLPAAVTYAWVGLHEAVGTVGAVWTAGAAVLLITLATWRGLRLNSRARELRRRFNTPLRGLVDLLRGPADTAVTGNVAVSATAG
ncbi:MULTISPECIES: NACHT domain-containing NTPase [unclassified Streptomyces]|uniref:NACHT domain-containing protein n=1 Tax=unclassified Streptomyces TaxID=2593676 RepID=UPI00278C52FC|nr:MULTISPECIES: NACHT domain-containing protein [unclassified Streptomyces]